MFFIIFKPTSWMVDASKSYVSMLNTGSKKSMTSTSMMTILVVLSDSILPILDSIGMSNSSSGACYYAIWFGLTLSLLLWGYIGEGEG